MDWPRFIVLILACRMRLYAGLLLHRNNIAEHCYLELSHVFADRPSGTSTRRRGACAAAAAAAAKRCSVVASASRNDSRSQDSKASLIYNEFMDEFYFREFLCRWRSFLEE